MTKQRIQGFIAGLLVSVLLVTTLTFASGTIREVFYGVNVVVNGVPQEFDADSQPFISDGRTFLPIRAIAETLGVEVNWDGETRTVYIGTPPIGAAITEHPIIGRWNLVEVFEDGVLVYPEDDDNYETHLTFFSNGEGYVEILWVSNDAFLWSIYSGVLTVEHEWGIYDADYHILDGRLHFSVTYDWGLVEEAILERID